MKRTVIFMIDSLGMGGAERMMIPILRYLSREEFELRVCVLQEREGNPLAEDIRVLGVPVDWLPVRYLRDLTAIQRMTRYLREVGADLVHTQLEFSNVLGNISARLLHLPGVSTIHVLPSGQTNLKRSLHDSLEGFVLRNFCVRIIAVADIPRQLFIKATGAPPSQVITIHNGIDLDDFSSINRHVAREEARAELGIPRDAKVLTTVAVLRREKGIDHMIRAFPAILNVNPDAYYLIVGDGPEHKSLSVQAAGNELHGRVILPGMRSDVPRLLAASDLFVLPTLTEALPTVLAEAMAFNLPIIASAVGGVPEMVADGRNGYLVQPRDVEALSKACNHLLSDHELLLTMGRCGKEIVEEKFSIRQQVAHLKSLYLELIDRYEK